MLRSNIVLPTTFSRLSLVALLLPLTLACKEEAPPRAKLPPPEVKSAAMAPKPPTFPEGPFDKTFGIAELAREKCVSKGDPPLLAEHCPGIVLFGPYTLVPPGARVSAAFELEGDKGSTRITVDLVGGSGARLLATAGTFELKPGQKQSIQLATDARVGEETLEARIWSSGTPDAVFKINDAKLEIHRK